MSSSTVTDPAQGLWFLDGQTDETHRLHRVPILALPFRIGRQPDMNLTISATMISSTHAELFENDRRLWVRDLGSTNGTFVNQQRVEEATPLEEGDIVHFAQLEFRLGFAPAPQAEAVLSQTIAIEADLPDLVIDKSRILTEMMRTRSLGAVFQPIVTLYDGATLGYEVLGRGRLDGDAVASAELFRAAEVLGAEAELSRLFRTSSVSQCLSFPGRPEFFINTHPTEIGSQELLRSLEEFREAAPDLRVVLEIHEAAVTGPETVSALQEILRDLNMALAYDDFGAGQTRLLEIAEVPPDYLKFDLCMIRHLEEATSSRLKVVRGLVDMARDLGVTTIAEGIETEEEAEACRQIGFDLGQGYLFGVPLPAESES